ncbi:hypothetical protein ABW20_dc0101366 [Dactylellina cionopaga]|nr:hypothetical protein ABW20_dc0101366 [Dactylellina cionopaga]
MKAIVFSTLFVLTIASLPSTLAAPEGWRYRRSLVEKRQQYQGTLQQWQQQYCTAAYQQSYPQQYAQNCGGRQVTAQAAAAPAGGNTNLNQWRQQYCTPAYQQAYPQYAYACR